MTTMAAWRLRDCHEDLLDPTYLVLPGSAPLVKSPIVDAGIGRSVVQSTSSLLSGRKRPL